MQVGADLQRLPEALADVAAALQITVQRAQAEYPMHPQVVEVLANCYQAMSQVASTAAEVPTAFQRLHESDIARHEAPRTNEQMWDVRR